MIARHIERRPIKSLLTVVGIALACAIMVLGSFFNDAIEHMIHVQFSLAQREDVAVTFVEPTSRRALYEFQSLPGVRRGEVFRTVPVRLRHGHRTYRTSIQGFEPGGDLQRLLDDDLRPIELPPAGIVLTDFLGEILDAAPGDVLTVEVLEGGRPVREVPVAGLVSGYIGVSGYMQISALNRMMREGAAISGCFLAMDADHHESTYQAIKGMPRVAATVVREKSVDNFYETMGEHVLTFAFFNTLLAGAIAFGVVYNSARIALSERGRELASLRVLGFTRGEISYILFGELGALTLAAIPLGFVLGYAFAAHMIYSLQTDLFRIPLVVEPSTFGFAALVVVISALISSLIVRHKLDHLDLVAVLKTKE